MSDLQDLKSKLEDRLAGLKNGQAQKHNELAQLEAAAVNARDVINATSGAVAECQKMLDLLGEQEASRKAEDGPPVAEDDYPKLAPLEPKSPPPPERGIE
jgi:chromosome segregation ATPase